MSDLSRDDIKWATDALRSGQSPEFVASVLEVPPKRVRSLVRAQFTDNRRVPRAAIDGKHVWRASEADTSSARVVAEQLFKNDGENIESDDDHTENAP